MPFQINFALTKVCCCHRSISCQNSWLKTIFHEPKKHPHTVHAMMLMFAVWPQTLWHNDLCACLGLRYYVSTHHLNLGIVEQDVITSIMNAYTTLPVESTFVTLYYGNQSLQAWNYPVNLRPTHTGWMPIRTARDTTYGIRRALSTCRAHPRLFHVPCAEPAGVWNRLGTSVSSQYTSRDTYCDVNNGR